jgi:hypothetical protein
MAIDVTAEILIDRQPEEVAQVMFNPKMDKIWIRELKEVYPMQSGLYQKGAKVERIGVFLNRHYSNKLLVTKFEENKLVECYGDEPFEMKIRYQLKEVDSKTLVKISIMSFGEILFNMPVSLISKSLLENVQSDLKRLKKHLENSE